MFHEPIYWFAGKIEDNLFWRLKEYKLLYASNLIHELNTQRYRQK